MIEIFNLKKCNEPNLKKGGFSLTLRSLLLVRKSVEGFKMDVMARASSSCTVLPFTAEQVSVLNTYCTRGGKKKQTKKNTHTHHHMKQSETRTMRKVQHVIKLIIFSITESGVI